MARRRRICGRSVEVRTSACAPARTWPGSSYGRRVTGLVSRRDRADNAAGAGGAVMAAGAVQTPHILELSGVRDPGAPSAAGLAVRHAFPGVNRSITLNEATRGWRPGGAAVRNALTGKGILSAAGDAAHRGHLGGVETGTVRFTAPTRHPGYAASLRCRKRIEEAFGWIKAQAGVAKVTLRGQPEIEALFTFAVAAYNLVRMPKLLALPAA